MWAEINGERKKVACGPCIRGHRSSKCDHRDRVLIEVRKPGRPLSSCPHPTGSCSCERVVINYTIPKTSECACPSEQVQPTPSATANRVQKTRARKSSINPASLERAIKASQDAETDSSSLITQTPTNPSFAPSEKSLSNGVSPPSSASSTPRLLASPIRHQSLSADARSADNSPSLPPPSLSSCCEPSAAEAKIEPVVPKQSGSCCSSKPKPATGQVPAQKKSCCGGFTQPAQNSQLNTYNPTFAPGFQPNTMQNHAQIPFQQQQQPSFPAQAFNPMYPNFNYNMSGNMGMQAPFGFNTPIYNHMASVFQQAQPQHFQTAAHVSRGSEHNCHCGDGCSCFGCAAHPNNATMTEYVRLMHQYMSTGGFGALPPPAYDIPAYPHQPGFGAEATPNMAFNTMSPPFNFGAYSNPNPAFPPNLNASMSIPNTPMLAHSAWQQTPPSITPAPIQAMGPSMPRATQDTPYLGTANDSNAAPAEIKPEISASSPMVADSPSDGRDEDAPTLSPSSYFWSELVLPGCNDATGTCQCGDGCECVGCLTHGGHNGVTLDSGTAADQQTFEQVVAENSDSNVLP